MTLEIPEAEARALFARLHRSAEDQERFCDLYTRLQAHFFETLTLDQLQTLLEENP